MTKFLLLKMNLVVIIKILIGTYTLSIGDRYTVLSFEEDHNPSVKKVVQVIDLQRNMVFKIKDGLITDSVSIDKIKKSTNLKLIKETKTDFQKVIATINCDERRCNYSISNYLNGSGQRDLFIKKYLNSENRISSKLSERGTYFLPFIGSKDVKGYICINV